MGFGHNRGRHRRPCHHIPGLEGRGREEWAGPRCDSLGVVMRGALQTRSPRSAIESFPGVRRAKIKEERKTAGMSDHHYLTVRVGPWNLKASYDAGSFDNLYAYDYKIATAGTVGAKVFRSLDDAKKWLGRFGAIREVPPTYFVTLLNRKDPRLPLFLEGQIVKRDRAEASVNATYTNTSQSLEFQFSEYGFVEIFEPLCMK